MSAEPEQTERAPSRAAVLHRLRTLHSKYTKASTALRDLEAERAAVYRQARQVEPPITYRQIAEIFGITEAAVMQKARRHERSRTKVAS